MNIFIKIEVLTNPLILDLKTMFQKFQLYINNFIAKLNIKII